MRAMKIGPRANPCNLTPEALEAVRALSAAIAPLRAAYERGELDARLPEELRSYNDTSPRRYHRVESPAPRTNAMPTEKGTVTPL